VPDYPQYRQWLKQRTLDTVVKSHLKRRLTTAQHAIAYTRGKLAHGAGNIRAQIEAFGGGRVPGRCGKGSTVPSAGASRRCRRVARSVPWGTTGAW
jgi:hypothetical protein